VTRDRKRAKCTEISTILYCKQTEGNDDKKNSFLVHMPAEQKSRKATQSDCSHEIVPCWGEEDLDECRLEHVSTYVIGDDLDDTHYLRGDR